MSEPLPRGSTIGILGGGQLGRMLSMAAARLGYSTHIFEPQPEPPAGHVAAKVTTASYDDHPALEEFATQVDVITYEFENVPAASLDVLEGQCAVRPGREALRISQDRLIEKEFLQSLGLRPAPFANVETRQDLSDAVAAIGLPAILKTRRFGYDGKGQVRITSEADCDQAFADMNGAPAVLEGFVSFKHEVSVIAARGASGAVTCYDPGQNVHRNGILHSTILPADLTAAQRTQAVLMAGQILNALDYIGVMGVELFVTVDDLIVNEIAPRVHNSGHWTQQGCAVDQFEQHIRAVTDHDLGDPTRYADVEMINLIGEDINTVHALMSEPNTSLHVYGKDGAKPGRKMGHVNRILGPKSS